MLEFVAHFSRLSQRDSEGATAREHLQAAVRMGHRGPEVLEGPALPPALAYLWDWWRELAVVRRYSMAGAEPISYTEVDAWARLTDQRPEPHEVRALMRIDAEFRHPPEEE